MKKRFDFVGFIEEEKQFLMEQDLANILFSNKYLEEVEDLYSRWEDLDGC